VLIISELLLITLTHSGTNNHKKRIKVTEHSQKGGFYFAYILVIQNLTSGMEITPTAVKATDSRLQAKHQANYSREVNQRNSEQL